VQSTTGYSHFLIAVVNTARVKRVVRRKLCLPNPRSPGDISRPGPPGRFFACDLAATLQEPLVHSAPRIVQSVALGWLLFHENPKFVP